MEQMIKEMLSAIDAQDMRKFGSCLSEEARFVFGNGEVIYGREKIVATVTAVLQSLKSISHTAQRSWSFDGVAICEGRVLYLDGLGQPLDVPFVDVLNVDARGLINRLSRLRRCVAAEFIALALARVRRGSPQPDAQ